MRPAARESGPPRVTPAERRAQILDAAMEEFVAHGFSQTTMLAIARRARASKETVYELFGSKEKLFEALITGRALQMQAPLRFGGDGEAADEAGAGAGTGVESDPIAVLIEFARGFLELWSAPDTVAFYRLAIAEVKRFPSLGRSLHGSGRLAVRARLTEYLETINRTHPGLLVIPDPAAAVVTFFTHLIGDWQAGLLLGVMTTPDASAIAARAEETVRVFLALHGGPAVSPGAAGLSHTSERND